jgi:tRNA(Ile)-lysidine synthase
MTKTIDAVKTVERYIRCKLLFEAGEKILAAVSGGADSLCLLLALKELGYPLHVAHFDHRLRPESLQEAETVRQTAARLGIPFLLGQGDVRVAADRKRMTLEEAARELRYEFLLHTAEDLRCGAIATGHTMDDQAETVLMHLIRGAGLRGLGGIRPSGKVLQGKEDSSAESVRIVRPLLCLTHEQTDAFCRQKGFIPLEDPSNRDPAFTRNRIRMELLPLLKRYNETVVEGLSRLAEIAREQDDFLERTAEEIWEKHAVELTRGLVRIPRDVFHREPKAVRRALVRRAVLNLKGTLHDLDFRHVDRALNFMQTPAGPSRTDLALGVEASLEKEWLVFRSPADMPKSPGWEAAELPLPGNLSIRHPDWRFEVSWSGTSELPLPDSHADPWTAWIDPGRIRMPLRIRKRRAGDLFLPAGMPEPVSLNGFFSSHHLSLSERDLWPLVCDVDGIIWVPGYRLKAGIFSPDMGSRWIKIRIDH